MAQVLQVIGGDAGYSLNTTYYAALGMGLLETQTSEAAVQHTVRSTGKYSNLYCRVWSGTSSATLRFRTGGGNGNQTVSITTATTGEFQDTTNSDTVAAGNLINAQIVVDNVGAGKSIKVMSIQFSADSNTVTKLMATGSQTLSVASTSSYFPLGGSLTGLTATTLANEAYNQYKAKAAFTLQNLQINITTNGNANAATLSTRKGGVSQNLTLSITNGVTGWFEDTGHSDTVASADLWNYILTTGTGTVSLVIASIGVEVSSTKGQSFGIAAGDDSNGPSGVNYYPIVGSLLNTGTESRLQWKTTRACLLSMLEIYIRVNSISLASTFLLRRNASNSTLSVSVTANTTGEFEDATHIISMATTDEASGQWSVGGSGTTITDTLVGMMFTYDNFLVSDTTTVTDVATILIPTYKPSVSDTTTVTDSAVLSINVGAPTPNVFDSTAVTDAVTILIPANLLSVSDSTAVTDVVTSIGLYPKQISVADTTTVTDATTMLITAWKPNVSDTTTVTDSATLSLISYINVNDSTAVTDATTMLITSWKINVNDSTAVTDAVTMLITSWNPSVFDSTTVTDSATLSLTSYISVNDTTTVTDSATLTISAPKINVSDTTTVTDSATLAISAPQITVSDSTTVTDSATVTISAPQINVSDTTTVTDSATITVSAPQINVFDTITVTDSANLSIVSAGTVTMSVNDTITVNDATTIGNIPVSTKGVLRRWNGSVWVKAKLKTYVNGSFVRKPLKYWNGSTWITVDTTGI